MRPELTGRGRSLAFAAIVGALAAGCGAGIGRTFEPGVEYIPDPGYADVVGDPPNAPEALAIDWIDEDGTISDEQRDKVAAGDPIKGNLIGNPGRYQVIVNGMTCSGSFTLTSTKLAHLVLAFQDGECTVFTNSVVDWPVGYVRGSGA